MTGPEDRQISLARVLAEFEALLAQWYSDEAPVDIADLTGLP